MPRKQYGSEFKAKVLNLQVNQTDLQKQVDKWKPYRLLLPAHLASTCFVQDQTGLRVRVWL